MTTFIAGGTGFIGRRLVPLLAQRGEEIVGTDIDPQTADFGNPGKQVKVTRPVSGFGVQYRPYRERVLQIINDIRKEEGLPELAPQ